MSLHFISSFGSKNGLNIKIKFRVRKIKLSQITRSGMNILYSHEKELTSFYDVFHVIPGRIVSIRNEYCLFIKPFSHGIHGVLFTVVSWSSYDSINITFTDNIIGRVNMNKISTPETFAIRNICFFIADVIWNWQIRTVYRYKTKSFVCFSTRICFVELLYYIFKGFRLKFSSLLNKCTWRSGIDTVIKVIIKFFSDRFAGWKDDSLD